MAVVNTLIAELKYRVDTSGLREFRVLATRAVRDVERQIYRATRAQSSLNRASRATVAIEERMSREMLVYKNRVRGARNEMARLAATSRTVGTGGTPGHGGGGEGGRGHVGGEVAFLGALAGGFAIFGSALASDQMQSAVARIRLVVDKDQIQSAIDEIYQVAQSTGQSYTDIVDLFQRTQRTVGNVGKSIKITDLITKAAVIGGGTSESQAQGIRQLQQSLASGEFSGDELRSIRENLPRVASIIASAYSRQMGKAVSVGELSDLSGKLGGLKIAPFMDELFRQSKLINKQFAVMPKTFGRGVTVMLNSYKQFVYQLNKSVGISEAFYHFSELVAENMKTIMKYVGLILGTAGLKGIAFVLSMLGKGTAAWLVSWAKMAAVMYAIWLIGQDIWLWLQGGNAAGAQFYQWVADTLSLLEPVANWFQNIAHTLGLSSGELGSWVSLLFAGFGVAYALWKVFKGIRNTIIAIAGIKGVGSILGKGKKLGGKGIGGKAAGGASKIGSFLKGAALGVLKFGKGLSGIGLALTPSTLGDSTLTAWKQQHPEQWAKMQRAADVQMQAAQAQSKAADKLSRAVDGMNQPIMLDPINVTATPLPSSAEAVP